MGLRDGVNSEEWRAHYKHISAPILTLLHCLCHSQNTVDLVWKNRMTPHSGKHFAELLWTDEGPVVQQSTSCCFLQLPTADPQCSELFIIFEESSGFERENLGWKSKDYSFPKCMYPPSWFRCTPPSFVSLVLLPWTFLNQIQNEQIEKMDFTRIYSLCLRLGNHGAELWGQSCTHTGLILYFKAF